MKFLLLFFVTIVSAEADTIDHYMNIANQIPQMEMKADQQSQTWARSARTVLILTSESIAETLILSNEEAQKKQWAFILFTTKPTIKCRIVK